MKKRNGFVSNSSTQSFFIYGVSFDDDETFMKRVKENVSDGLKQLILEENNKNAQGSQWTQEFDNFDKYMESLENWYDLFSALKNVAEGISIDQPPYDSIYIGVSPSAIKDDETGREFKERVKTFIRSLLGEDVDGFGYCSQAWRDD